MAVDELDAVGDDAVGDGDGLLGIAGIVIKDDLEGLPVDAAILVDGLCREFGAVLELLADAGDRTGHRSGHGDGDILCASNPGSRQQGQDGQTIGGPSLHGSASSFPPRRFRPIAAGSVRA
jgi:hypothetical protein